MDPTARSALARSQVAYFRHDVMRFFAQQVLQLGYEEQPSSRTDLRDAFCFDSVARVMSRPSDWLTPLALRDAGSLGGEARRLAGFLVSRVRHKTSASPVFRVAGLPTCGMVVHPRDQTHVVVQRRPRAVWKVANDSRHTGVFDNERDAARLAPGFAAAVLDFGRPAVATPGWLSLEYVLNTEPISASELSGVLQRITQPLAEVYGRAGIEITTAAVTLDEVAAGQRALRRGPESPFTVLAADVLQRIARFLEPRSGCRAVYTAFAHGDIQRSNLRRSKGRIRLIDWGSGGRCHVLHDAFIVELFSPTASIWHDLLLTGRIADPASGFEGWLPAVLDRMADVLKVRLSGTEIAAGMVCSMAEKALRTIERFMDGDEERGVGSLARIQALLSVAPPPITAAQQPATMASTRE
jgi:hypothetical protein